MLPLQLLFLLSQIDLYVGMLSAFAVVVLAKQELVTKVGIAGILLLIGWLLIRLLQRYYTRYVITNFRIIRLSGVLRRDYEWIAWNRVTDVAVHRSVMDRIAQTATIRIQSANEQSGFKAMTDIPDPDAFAAQITELVNARRGVDHPRSAPYT